MRIFNQDKTQELTSPDLTLGYLQENKLFIAHHEAVEAIEEQGHYITVAKYPNGGKDVEWVVDVPGVEAKEAYDEYEDIQIYIPFTTEELAQNIRIRREMECFPIINRGALWYEKLTAEQKSELSVWYEAWLNAPQTLIVPTRPEWIEWIK